MKRFHPEVKYALALWVALGILAAGGASPQAGKELQMKRQYLRDHWSLQSTAVEPRQGAELSQPGVELNGWYPIQVPTTVLRALIQNGVYPDPRFGLNAFRIPDSSEEFNREHDLARFSHLPNGRNPWRDPWWYRTEFDLEALPKGARVWLNLDCLNYRAEVWVNGHRIAGPERLVGMFQRFRLDLTGCARPGRNALAVLVYPVDHPGTPDAQLQVYGPVRGFHKEILKDVTEVMTIGYDCFPTVPDRNMGLLQDVSLDVTGPVDLRHPFVRAHLPLPELTPATLTLSAELVNASPEPVQGTVHGEVRGPEGELVARFAEEVFLPAGESRTRVWSGDTVPSLRLSQPRLWWPHGYGEQPLYELSLRFEADGQPASQVQTAFGLRRLDRELHVRDGAHGLRLRVNGEPVFCRGGYIQPEMMFDWDEERLATEVRYLTEANLNYVVFEDIPNPPEAFLDACDRAGLMFWNCFYGCYWMQPGTEYPADLDLLEACTVDLVKRYRNHPSLVLYMAQNEGETRQEVYTMWRRRVLELDDTRFLVPSGSFPDYRTDIPEWIRPDTPVGLNDYNPKSYSWQTPATYYRWVRQERNWMFMIESGSASVPPLESLEQFLPGLREKPPNSGDDPVYPLDAAWAHFGANSYYEWFDRALRALYGEPKDVRDYVWKAHLVAYDQHRAMFEAVNHRMWEITSGFGEWKLNSAWPDVQWQLYDWFLRPTPSLFAVRKAGAPLHVQLSPLDSQVTVVNNQRRPEAGLEVRGTVYGPSLHPLEQRIARLDIGPHTYREAFVLPQPTSTTEAPIYFVKLELWDREGRPRADNFYWLSPRLYDCEPLFSGDLRQLPANRPVELPRQRPCFPELQELPPASLQVEAVRRPAGSGRREEERVRVQIANPTDRLAFFIRLRLTDGPAGEEVRPLFWEDNCFSLLPGEGKAVEVRFPSRPGRSAGLFLQVDGWNIPPTAVPVRKELSERDDQSAA